MNRNQHITSRPKRGTATVYLLHLWKRYKHAGHYIGFTTDLDQRLTDHLCGRGARLLEVVTEAGIEWRLARTWRGDRGLERRLKRWNGAASFCPICSGKAAMKRAAFASISIEAGKVERKSRKRERR